MSKKGSKAQPKEQSYEVRDIVLAKVRGYPPWPGIVSTSSLPLCPCARGVPQPKAMQITASMVRTPLFQLLLAVYPFIVSINFHDKGEHDTHGRS